jgi:hypothetical protein
MSESFAEVFQMFLEQTHATLSSGMPDRPPVKPERSSDDQLSLPPPTPFSDRLLFSGRPHHNYARHKTDFEGIFSSIFPHWDEVSEKDRVLPIANIPESTIYRGKNEWTVNPAWRPWKMKENHGYHNRQFTDEQEAEITSRIVSEDIEVGQMFTSEAFRALTSQYWINLGGDPTSSFISDFKIGSWFSSRRFHMKRRNPRVSKEDISRCVRQIKDLFLEYHDELWLVVNCDETAWRILPNGSLTWAPVGTGV